MRGATLGETFKQVKDEISIHAPRAGCDFKAELERVKAEISIHAPRAGCDLRPSFHVLLYYHFNPRTPCGVRPFVSPSSCHSRRNFNPRTPCGVRLLRHIQSARQGYFNPRTPCGVRLLFHASIADRWLISIHAPRAGCDEMVFVVALSDVISIHAPRAGCDVNTVCILYILQIFQSTHPVRGATPKSSLYFTSVIYFNPRTPCGVRPLP